MRAAESRLPSVLPKVGSCSGLEAKAQFAFSCLKLACCLHSLSVVFYWVLCGKQGARPWPHQGVSHLCCPGSQNSSERGSLECSRCALVCPCWGSHGQLEQPPRLPVPECFSHHILIMMRSTPTLEPLNLRPPAQLGGPLPPIDNRKIQAQNQFISSLQNGDVRMSWCQEFSPFSVQLKAPALTEPSLASCSLSL